MNIIKYLHKADIDAQYSSKTNSFTFYVDDEEIVLKRKDIEQYLFICLINLIEDEKKKK